MRKPTRIKLEGSKILRHLMNQHWITKYKLRFQFKTFVPPECFHRRFNPEGDPAKTIDSFKNAVFSECIINLENGGYIERRWPDGRTGTRNDNWEARLTPKGLAKKAQEKGSDIFKPAKLRDEQIREDFQALVHPTDGDITPITTEKAYEELAVKHGVSKNAVRNAVMFRAKDSEK